MSKPVEMDKMDGAVLAAGFSVDKDGTRELLEVGLTFNPRRL